MRLSLGVIVVLMLVNLVQMQQVNVDDVRPYCRNHDSPQCVCTIFEGIFAFPPFVRAINWLSGMITSITSNALVLEVLYYVVHSFGPNPFDSSSYESMSKSFNLIIFQPNCIDQPRNISSTDVLYNCATLPTHGNGMKVLWSGYSDNCYGVNPTEALFHLTPDEVQRIANISNSTVVAIDWGFQGLSCYGYFQITNCLIDKIAEFFSVLFANCVDTDSLELIGHSISAHMVGYVAQRLAAKGKPPKQVIGLDPSGLGFEFGQRCQGIRKGTAKQTIVIHTNPCQLGTCDLHIGNVAVLINPGQRYCQPGCVASNPSCAHSYVLKIFKNLAHNVSMSATHTHLFPVLPGVGSNSELTLHNHIPNGYYVINTYNTTN